MATVTTPTGDKLEGVQGALLDYYRGEAATVEGYTIVDDEAEQAAAFPMVQQPGESAPVSAAPEVEEVSSGVEHPADGTLSPAVDNTAAGKSSGQHAADETGGLA